MCPAARVAIAACSLITVLAVIPAWTLWRRLSRITTTTKSPRCRSSTHAGNVVNDKVLQQRFKFPAGLSARPTITGTTIGATGQNSYLFIDASTTPGSGDGAQSLGAELGNSDAFASKCQVKKVFKRCLPYANRIWATQSTQATA